MGHDLERIARALERSWSSRSSSQWSAENPARGQCNATVLAVAELFGGRILKTPVGGLWHFYNELDGVVRDFTASQFEAPLEYRDLPSSADEARAGTTPEQLGALLGALRAALAEPVVLSPRQRELVDSLARRLGEIPGVAAVVLGGSFARGFARPESDLDLGVFYSEAAPFDVAAVRALAASVNDAPDPVVTDFYGWGPWVNGGAWLTIGGQRVDFLYRALEHLERVIADARAGRFELHWGQQPPFGFFGPTYLGELAICVPLFDPAGCVAALKRAVAEYPEALRRAVVQTYLWQCQFALESFAPKYAARGDPLGTAGCLSRVAHQLVLVLFALNRRYLVSEKTALAEIAGFPQAPRAFGARISALLASPGASPEALAASVGRASALVAETVALAGPLYVRPY